MNEKQLELRNKVVKILGKCVECNNPYGLPRFLIKQGISQFNFEFWGAWNALVWEVNNPNEFYIEITKQIDRLPWHTLEV